MAGTVQDESGAFVAGAKVTLTEVDKGLVRESASDYGGTFLFPSVIAGNYSLRVEKEGFRTQQVDGLTIAVGAQSSFPITLQVGEFQTAMTVRLPAAVELDVESNAIGSVVDSERVQELPLNGRNFLQLALLTGGATEISPASDMVTGNVGPPGRNVILPGTMPYSVGYTLNGINIRGSRDGELAVSPSVAAVDQFKVEASFLMPDQGTGTPVVNIVTRSGNNQYHGEAYEFVRNQVFDARSFFAASREDLKRNQFGAAVGGPLRKDRIWFHGFYEGLRELTAFSTAGYSPTPAMFAGNFSGTERVIYDPQSYRADLGTRQPFPESAVPAAGINRVSDNLLEYYLPGISLASRPNNVFGNPKKTLRDDQGGIRIDSALSPRSQLFAQVFVQDTPSAQPGLYPFSGLLYLNGGQLAMLQHVWSVSPRAVNSLRIGFLRNTAIGGNEAQAGGPSLEAIGVRNTFEKAGVSAVQLQGYSPFGRANGEIGNRDNAWQVDEELTYTSGQHRFAVGVGLRYRRGWHVNGNTLALGTLSFQSSFTAQLARNAQGQPAPIANTGDAFADFLLGYPVSGLVLGLPAVEYRGTQVAPFFQDTWKVTRNLTVNYGLSWFLDTFPRPYGWARDAVHTFDHMTGLLRFAALGEANTQASRTDKNNLAPRAGLAWKPGFLNATVIRAGAGLLYSELPWVVAPYPINSGSPYTVTQTFTNPLTVPSPAFALGVNIFPQAAAPALTSAYAANLPAGTVATALSPDYRTAYAAQWNVSVQHSAGDRDFVELSYLGSTSHRLPTLADLSQCRPTPNLFCDPAARPWPRYGLMFYGDSAGNSSYSTLIAKYDHRMEHGLNLRLEYAFGKALTDSWQSALRVHNQISQCRSCSKSLANFDVRHRLAASVIADLPFGRGKRYGATIPRWTDALVGGWRLTGIVTFSTGQPVVMKGPNQTGSNLVDHLPNRVCDGRSDRLSRNIRTNGFLWFDTACFPVPPVGYFGNSGPTVLPGPGLRNWDLGVQKSLPFSRDAARLDLRVEMFNAWNHAQFQQPNGDAGAGANFGRISSTRPPRVIQIGIKMLW